MQRTIPILAIGLALLAACDGDSSRTAVDTIADTTGDTGPNDVADTSLPPSPLSIELAERQDQLIGGPMPLGQVGAAWILGNDRVRFMVQDVGASVLYHLYGGSLIGGERVGDGVVANVSTIREVVPIVDFRLIAATEAKVVDDGATGERVTLRFEGPLQPSGIIGILDTFAGDDPLDAAIEYEVRAGEAFLRIRSEVHNPGAQAVDLVVGDFIVSGGINRLFTPGRGLNVGGTVGTDKYLVMAADDVSYAYVDPTVGRLNLPVVDVGGTVALLETGARLNPGATIVTERRLLIGDGSIDSVVAAADAMVGEAQGTVAGTISGGPDEDLTAVRVTALPVRSGGAEPTRARNQAHVDASGAWHMTLPPGDYHLITHGDGRAPSAPASVTVTADDEQTVSLTVRPVATVTVDMTGDGPRPSDDGTFPVRVALRPLGESYEDERLDEPGFWRGWRLAFLGAGDNTVNVPEGRYEVVMSHGYEHTLKRFDDVLLTDGSVLDGHLARVVATPGWLSCDFHQHTIGSLDSGARLDARVRENLAEGLECATTTEHDHVVDMRPVVQALGGEAALHTIIGDEVSVNGVGHYGAYPMPLNPADPFALSGVKLYAGLTIQELFTRLRGLDGERVIQVNHPRDGNLKGFFANLSLDPWDLAARRGALPSDWDALEVNTSLGNAANFTVAGWRALRELAPGNVPVLADWFGLLNAGHPICGVANSDCHEIGDDCGNPRTYVGVGDDPATVTDAEIIAALKRQHAIGSRGIWLSVTANGAAKMGHTELVDGNETVALRIVATAPPFVTVSHVELYVNGLFVERRDAATPGTEGDPWIDTTFSVTPEVDSWYVFVVRGGGNTAPAFSGSPFAFTNPVYIDADSDSVFTAPGPVALDE